MAENTVDLELAQSILERMQKKYATVYLRSGQKLCIESVDRYMFASNEIAELIGSVDEQAPQQSDQFCAISFNDIGEPFNVLITVNNVSAIHLRSLRCAAAAQLKSEL